MLVSSKIDMTRVGHLVDLTDGVTSMVNELQVPPKSDLSNSDICKGSVIPLYDDAHVESAMRTRHASHLRITSASPTCSKAWARCRMAGFIAAQFMYQWTEHA